MRDRQIDRQTARQTLSDRQTDRDIQTDRQTDSQTDRQTDTEPTTVTPGPDTTSRGLATLKHLPSHASTRFTVTTTALEVFLTLTALSPAWPAAALAEITHLLYKEDGKSAETTQGKMNLNS